MVRSIEGRMAVALILKRFWREQVADKKPIDDEILDWLGKPSVTGNSSSPPQEKNEFSDALRKEPITLFISLYDAGRIGSYEMGVRAQRVADTIRTRFRHGDAYSVKIDTTLQSSVTLVLKTKASVSSCEAMEVFAQEEFDRLNRELPRPKLSPTTTPAQSPRPARRAASSATDDNDPVHWARSVLESYEAEWRRIGGPMANGQESIGERAQPLIEAMALAFLGKEAFIERKIPGDVQMNVAVGLNAFQCLPFVVGEPGGLATLHDEMQQRANASQTGEFRQLYQAVETAIQAIRPARCTQSLLADRPAAQQAPSLGSAATGSSGGAKVKDVLVFCKPVTAQARMLLNGSLVNGRSQDDVLRRQIARADKDIGLAGALVRHAEDHKYGYPVQQTVLDVKDGDGWDAAINRRAFGKPWKRWWNRGADGEWSIVVFM